MTKILIGREDLIRMAHEAEQPTENCWLAYEVQFLERFAALVAQHESEVCAITAWSAGMDAHNAARGLPCDAREVGSKAAQAIRSRSNK